MNIKKLSSSLFAKVGAGLCLATAGTIVWAQTSSTPTQVAITEPKAEGGPLAMRRLTESQYRATIAQVFAPNVPIAGRFERGLREEGLISAGTSRGGMSAFAVEQYDASARGIAAHVTSPSQRSRLVPCQPKSETAFDQACADKFVDRYGLKLFRRPLERAERQRYVAVAKRAQQSLGNFYQGLEFALVGMLTSPNFLMRIEEAEPDPHHPEAMKLDAWSRASRLSFFLTNASPDDELLRAAGAGELATEEGLAGQVDRLLASPKLEGAIRAFFWDMLAFDGFNDLFKDPAIYPAYTTDVAREAQEQTLRTIVTVLVTERGDYRDLFTTRKTWMTRPLGVIYRQPVAARNGWEQLEYSQDSQRAGILTDISMLALHSHPGRSSPTLRGKSLRETFLCEKVPDPPANVDFSIVQDAVSRPGSTARMRLAEHTENPVCAACHTLTDPMGLTMESFDGAGTFRDKENGAKLDLTGGLDNAEFTGATGLGRAMHDSPKAPACLTQKLYRSAVGREVSKSEEPFVKFLLSRFAAERYRLPNLMRVIALSKTFYSVSMPIVPAKTNTAAAFKKRDRS